MKLLFECGLEKPKPHPQAVPSSYVIKVTRNEMSSSDMKVWMSSGSNHAQEGDTYTKDQRIDVWGINVKCPEDLVGLFGQGNAVTLYRRPMVKETFVRTSDSLGYSLFSWEETSDW